MSASGAVQRHIVGSLALLCVKPTLWLPSATVLPHISTPNLTQLLHMALPALVALMWQPAGQFLLLFSLSRISTHHACRTVLRALRHPSMLSRSHRLPSYQSVWWCKTLSQHVCCGLQDQQQDIREWVAHHRFVGAGRDSTPYCVSDLLGHRQVCSIALMLQWTTCHHIV